MVEAIGDQYDPETSEAVEVGLKAIATVDKSAIGGPSGSSEVADGGSLENSSSEDSSSSSTDDEISDILKFDENTYKKNEASHSHSHVDAGESSGVAGEVVEEEIVELEFEKVKPKLSTHSMHCPNCKAEVTKVILRRKVITFRSPEPAVVPVEEPQRDPNDLVGCLSCLSLFTCSGNGCFNPFDIFRKKADPTNVLPPQTTVEGTTATPVVTENENCFSMFLVFKKKQKVAEIAVDPPQSDPVLVNREVIIPDQSTLPKYVTGNTSIAKGQPSVSSPQPPSTVILKDKEVTSVVDSDGEKKRLLGGNRLPYLPPSTNVAVDDDTTIDVETEEPTENEVVMDAAVGGRRTWFGYDGILAEILKSIVYGGLMEVIASLSIVASAAASDTTTLNIIALALASLIGGIIIIGHNLWDLRDDCHKETPNQQTEGGAINKYKELLGRINYFPLHAFFAILSFVIFGMVPPVAYGFTFHKTNDRDFTMSAVAITSLLCVSLLAIFKAFINECGVLEYLKTVVYYITTAVSASGVSYVAGNLVTRLVTELGLFDTSLGGGMPLLPHASTTSLASF
ncbi:unnamed protein product [Lactuca virosa]|uniref:Membrane protein of ER body-like protein n=1 Tax=Lactuca virosa TaxID=75947 RepID=A0AAU9PAJ2_9ASTR|nr:unnamed protein product [Lactuca virosa]